MTATSRLRYLPGMEDPTTLVGIIEETIRRHTNNWVGPYMARGIAEDIVTQITVEEDLDRMGLAAMTLKAALATHPDDVVLKEAVYAVSFAETVLRERDEYVIALNRIVEAQKGGKPFDPYEIARGVLEKNHR